MKLPQIIFFCLLLFALNCIGQDIKKENPVLFGETISGGTFGYAGGFTIGGELDYQINRSLFIVRYSDNFNFRLNLAIFEIIAIPTVDVYSNLEERSILYGWRFINDGHSLSFSIGVSDNYFEHHSKENTTQTQYSKSRYIGIPYEMNIKWFKATKKKFRIVYGLIPIGKPTSFGHSFGLKIIGNASKYPYAGLAISYGIGWHKKY